MGAARRRVRSIPRADHWDLSTRAPSRTAIYKRGLLRPIPPEPPQRAGQERSPVLRAVPAGAKLELVVVAGKLQGCRHILVCERPVPVEVVQIRASILQENANRFRARLRFADQCRVDITAADIRKTADPAHHFA